MAADDRVALVSGAGSGIGRATSLALSALGPVVVADIDDVSGAETVDLIRGEGREATFVHVDVSKEDEIRTMFERTQAEYGALNILFNNAGILEAGARFPETPPERFLNVLDINLRGVILATYHAIPLMERSGGGVIVQTASSAAITPHRLHAIYAASKAGVLNFTRSLTYLHAERGIRVNCVCPGVVRTNLGARAEEAVPEEERAAFRELRANLRNAPALEPGDVAAAVLDLVRDESRNGEAVLLMAGRPPEVVEAPTV